MRWYRARIPYILLLLLVIYTVVEGVSANERPSFPSVETKAKTEGGLVYASSLYLLFLFFFFLASSTSLQIQASQHRCPQFDMSQQKPYLLGEQCRAE